MIEPLSTNADIKIIFFSNPEDFFEWNSQSEHYDLLITDINLPKISGIEIAHRMRTHGQKLPIYFISGFDERDYLKELKELHPYRYLPKPINFEEILSSLKLDLGIKN